MDIVGVLLGRPPRLRVLRQAPRHARWRRIRPRPQGPVQASPVISDIQVKTAHGTLHGEAEKDVLVKREDGECAIVRKDIFERTYEHLQGDLYRKRDDVVLRYFTLRQPVLVETMEGRQRAEAGDWIIEGVAGELWPVSKHKALEKYDQL